MSNCSSYIYTTVNQSYKATGQTSMKVDRHDYKAINTYNGKKYGIFARPSLPAPRRPDDRRVCMMPHSSLFSKGKVPLIGERSGKIEVVDAVRCC